MALTVYTPDFLDREQEAYTAANGNYSIDYSLKGDTPSVGTKNILGIPYKVKNDSFARNFNIYSSVIPGATAYTTPPHVSGVDENWRSFNFDVVMTATLSDEDFTLGYFGADLLQVEYQGTSPTSGDITYKVVGYAGPNNGRTSTGTASLFDTTATVYPLDIVTTTAAVGIVDEITLDKLRINPAWREPNGAPAIGYGGGGYLPIPLNITLKPSGTLVISGFTAIGWGISEEILSTFKEFLVVPYTPDTRVNIEVVSKIVTYDSGVTWETTNSGPLSSTVTNYKDAAANDHTLILDSHLLGYAGTLAKNTGVIFNISVTSLKNYSYRYTPSYNKYPTYNLYLEQEALRLQKAKPYMYFKRSTTNDVYIGRDIDSTKAYVDTLGDVTVSQADLWDVIANVNKTLNSVGSGTAITAVNGDFAAFKLTGNPEVIGISNSSYLPITGSSTSYIPSNADVNKLGISTSTFYTASNDAKNVSVDNNFNFMLALPTGTATSYDVVSHVAEFPLAVPVTGPVAITYNMGYDTPVAASVTFDAARTIGYNARKLVKLLRTDLDLASTLTFMAAPSGYVFIKNINNTISNFTITNIFDIFNSPSSTRLTSYNRSFSMPVEAGTRLFSVLNANDGTILDYTPLSELYGAPISLKIGGHNIANDFYLKLVISDDPDKAPNTTGSFVNNADKNLTILTDKINQYTRQANVLSSALNSTDIAIYKALDITRNAVIDTYVYAGNSVTYPFTATTDSNTNLTADSTKNYTGRGTNTSKDFWYFEDSIKQPFLLSAGVTNIVPSITYMQIVPGSSDTQIVLKIENNLSTYTYSMITVTLPAYSNYTGSTSLRDGWYSVLANSINVAIAGIIGAGTLVVTSQAASADPTLGAILIFTNNATGILRQVKVGVQSGSSVSLVKFTGYIEPVQEYVTTDIFPEFTSTTPNCISFWMG